MQKIDFIQHLDTIVTELNSEAITQQFAAGFAQPSQNFTFQNIIPFLFRSKSSYDNIKNDYRYSEIFKSFNAEGIYSENNLSSLANILRTSNATSVLPHGNAVAFYIFHRTLLATVKLAKEVLSKEILDHGLDEALAKGVIVFQVIIEADGLSPEKYMKIFSALKELINAISKVVNEEDESEIILLDSGSDTNIGIKTGIETARSIFLVFKELWDFLINYKHYKHGIRNKTLTESLTLIADIKRKVEDKILTEEEGREYIHIIKTRTDDLIGMKTVPKQIAVQKNEVENKKLLNEIDSIKLLTGGE